MAAIVDAKSLYDNSQREQYSKAEKRSALEICVIKGSLDSMDGECRWIPHERNPVDPLTKLNGNALPLLQLMKTHKFQLQEEAQVLKERKEFREATGRIHDRIDGRRTNLNQLRKWRMM